MKTRNDIILYKVEICEEYLNLVYDFDELTNKQKNVIFQLIEKFKKENE